MKKQKIFLSQNVIKDIKTNNVLGKIYNFQPKTKFEVLKKNILIKLRGKKTSEIINWLNKKKNLDKFLLRVNNKKYKLINIQDTYVAIRLETKTNKFNKFREINSDTKIFSAKDALWEIVEIEYKLNCDRNPADFIQSLVHEHNPFFDFGYHFQAQSLETYHLVKANRKIYNYDIISKSKLYPSAIKYSKKINDDSLPKNILRIILNTPENLEATIKYLAGKKKREIQISSLPPFLKLKTRCVCVHKNNGFVFGISGHHIWTKDKKSTLNQIEMEYWSKILPEGQQSNTSDPEIKPTIDLLNQEITKIAQQRNLNCLPTNMSKFEWLKKIKK